MQQCNKTSFYDGKWRPERMQQQSGCCIRETSANRLFFIGKRLNLLRCCVFNRTWTGLDNRSEPLSRGLESALAFSSQRSRYARLRYSCDADTRPVNFFPTQSSRTYHRFRLKNATFTRFGWTRRCGSLLEVILPGRRMKTFTGVVRASGISVEPAPYSLRP